jgi:hypothetical protein
MSTKISIAAIIAIAAVFGAPGISNAKTHTHASGSFNHHRTFGFAYRSAYGLAPKQRTLNENNFIAQDRNLEGYPQPRDLTC